MAVGDAIRTDVAGAAMLGVKSIFLLDGIHWNDVGRDGWREGYAGWLAGQALRPDFVMPRLRWEP